MTNNPSRSTHNREHLEKQLFGETGISSSSQTFPPTEINQDDNLLRNLDSAVESLNISDNEFYVHSRQTEGNDSNEKEWLGYGLTSSWISPHFSQHEQMNLNPTPSHTRHVSPRNLDQTPPRMKLMATAGMNESTLLPWEDTVFDMQGWHSSMSPPEQTLSYHPEAQGGRGTQQQQRAYDQQRVPLQQKIHGHYNHRPTQPLEKYSTSSDSFESVHSQRSGTISPRSPLPLYSPLQQQRKFEPAFPPHQQSPHLGHQSRVMSSHMLSAHPAAAHLQYQQQQQSVESGQAPRKNVYSRSSKRTIDPNKIEQTVYVVQFKVATKAFLLGYSAAANTAVGDHVLVSVEGGEDLGVVAQLITMREYLRLKALQILPGTSKYKFDNCMGRILRLATADEKGSLIQKACDEQEILEYCLELNQTKYQLPVLIAEVEYQFDRRVLSVHYSGLMRPDMFHEFTRAVAKTFKISNVVMVRIV